MARLYANENFPVDVVRELRALGHDVLTTHDVGKSNQGIEDDSVLRYATDNDRCVITINRRDFMRLHRANPVHGGIIVCTENRDYADFARRVDKEISACRFWPISCFGWCAEIPENRRAKPEPTGSRCEAGRQPPDAPSLSVMYVNLST